MTKPYSSILLGKIRSEQADRQLGLALAAIAGAINAGGYLIVERHTSHMTGIASSFAGLVGQAHFGEALPFLLWFVAFVGGAVVSTVLVLWGKGRKIHSVYALPLLLEALLLLILAGVVWRQGETTVSHSIWVVASLCFLMGLQNAVITKISEARIRTTHITGMTTDIGIALARACFFRHDPQQAIYAANKQRLRLHILLIGAFIGGGIVGTMLFHTVGFWAVVAPAVYLMMLSIRPLQRDRVVRRRVKRLRYFKTRQRVD
jgi:uncharacterized membrane protein YoaK (UPF0700 family)